MSRQMTEQELLEHFRDALKENHIFACYQPQINHSTGHMVGAEALMRWKDPENGMQYPSDFIPMLERYKLIYEADLHIFECVCRFQRKCLDNHLPTVPISVNMSRYDIIDHEYVKDIETLRRKYAVPVEYIRLELTESSAIGGMELVIRTIDELHQCGYIVEMDDFGSGYSSLNVLKDLNVDIIKLDMKFMSGHMGERGGIILNSIVQMAKWLDTPLIVEGVETMEQADYMKSLGCNYIQGYLYSKPIMEDEFLRKLQELKHEAMKPAMNLINTMNAGKFWNPESMETLIFSNFVGAAALFTYEEGKIDILRVNEKYLQETGMNQGEDDLVKSDPWESLDERNRKIYEAAIKRAIESNDEESCETWRTLRSKCCGEDKICIRSHLRVIGNAGKQHLIYSMAQNITAEKKNFAALLESETKFRTAAEHANVYAWEYTVATREMRPCFRCMRDLHLPPLVKNYPEPAIEMGIFPPDYADMYRDWHRRIEAGEAKLEAIIPLTVGRIPFHVRYTTEFDEAGRPVKAYGSATLVVDSPPSQAGA